MQICRLTLIALGLDNQGVRPGDENIDVRSDNPIDSGSFKVDDEAWFAGMYDGPNKKEGKISFYLFSHSQKPGYLDRHGYTSATHNFQTSLLDTQGTTKSLQPGKKHERFSGRLMDSTIGLDRLRHWVKASDLDCSMSQRHGEENPLEKSRLSAFSLRLSDVDHGNVVMFSAPVKFVALSYVWGDFKRVILTSQNEQQLRAQDWLSRNRSSLSHTVLDAIDLCRVLNFQYLWVDSLCIIQDSEEDKAQQISQMDLVYGLASLTIVQASTDPKTNANSPLPGFQPGTRNVKQEEVVIQGQRIILTCRAPFSLAVQSSKWYTRAWTLQELLLSRRLLYFTDQQVFLVSDTGHFFCEDTVFEHDRANVFA